MTDSPYVDVILMIKYSDGEIKKFVYRVVSTTGIKNLISLLLGN